jgi:hypothetical protein
MKIDVAKLDLELAHKGARQECPVCGELEWLADDTPAAVSAADVDSDEVVMSEALLAAILVCRNCGFIRLHAANVLLGEAD